MWNWLQTENFVLKIVQGIRPCRWTFIFHNFLKCSFFGDHDWHRLGFAFGHSSTPNFTPSVQ